MAAASSRMFQTTHVHACAECHDSIKASSPPLKQGENSTRSRRAQPPNFQVVGKNWIFSLEKKAFQKHLNLFEIEIFSGSTFKLSFEKYQGNN